MFEDTSEDSKDEWRLYLKNDARFLAFIYASHTMNMSKFTAHGMKNCFCHFLGWKFF